MMYRWWNAQRVRRLLVLAGLNMAVVLGGCNPDARGTILDGVNGAANELATTFINAFFETLQPEEPFSLPML